MKKLILILSVVLMMAFALPSAAWADGFHQGRIIFGDDYALESGETLTGDLLVLGGNVTLEEDSLVDGSVFVVGGNVTVDGEVDGDLRVVGGSVSLKRQALIRGDVSAMGGNMAREPGAVVKGEYLPGGGFEVPFSFSFPKGFLWSFSPHIDAPFRALALGFSPWIKAASLFFRTLLLAVLGVLAVMFWPESAQRVADSALNQPIPAAGLGLLTVIVVPVLLLMLLITILLSPLSLAGVVALVTAWVFGLIALGLEIGKRFAQALKWEIPLAAAAGLGTFILGLIVGGLGLIPCFGWVAKLLIGSLGLGGVILTRFGSRDYALASGAEMTTSEAQAVGEDTPSGDE